MNKTNLQKSMNFEKKKKNLGPDLKRRTLHEMSLITILVDPNYLGSVVESNVEPNSEQIQIFG